MDAREHARNTPDPGTAICLETRLGRRIAVRFLAVLVTFTVGVIALLGGLAIAIEVFRLSPAATLAFACLLAVLFSSVCWKCFLRKLRFSIVFHDDHLQIGRGFAACRFPYESIDTVSWKTSLDARGMDSWIHVKCGGRAAHVHLEAELAERCLMLVRRCCPNAMIVGRDGAVRLPTSPTQPDQTLIALERHLRQKAWWTVSASCGCAGLLAWIVWQLIQHAIGNQRMSDAAFVKSCVIAVFLLAGLPFMPRAVRNMWRTAAEVRDRRNGKSPKDRSGGNVG